jgi:hypothetical protein
MPVKLVIGLAFLPLYSVLTVITPKLLPLLHLYGRSSRGASRSKCATTSFPEGCDLDVSSFVSEGAEPSTMSSHFRQADGNPDYSLHYLQLYGLPADPAVCPLLPQS